MEVVARLTGRTKSAVYSDALDTLCMAVDTGGTIDSFPASIPTKCYSIKLPKEVVDRADAAIAKTHFPIKKSPFIREAVRRFLDEEPAGRSVFSSSGTTAPDDP